MSSSSGDPTAANEALHSLRDALPGRVVLPGDERYDGARMSWNLSVDQRPAAVVEAESAGDVQATVRAAVAAGLRVAPQATGHGSEPLGPLDAAILLKSAGLSGVTIDADARTARLGAGVRAAAAAEAAAPHGLAPVLGLAPGVGVTGLSVGGGTGWLSRAQGLAANNVRSFEIVLPSGEQRHVDAATEPDLFWALRGGGGRYGVITEIEVALHPVEAAFGGMRAWPADRAAEILGEYARWSAAVPESLGAVFRFLSLPPIEAVPEPLRGKRIVAVVAVNVGGETEGEELIAPLRAIDGAVMDTFASISPADLPRVAGDPEDPMPSAGDGFRIAELGPEVIHVLAGEIADSGPLTVLEVRLLGGALARAGDDDGPLGAINSPYSVFAGGAAPDGAALTAVKEALAGLREALAAWASPRALLGSARSGSAFGAGFSSEAAARLERLRDAFDPDRLILPNYDE